MLPTFHTPRLRLRWMTEADVSALLEVFGDPEVCRYWSRPALRDVGEARALLDEIVAGTRVERCHSGASPAAMTTASWARARSRRSRSSTGAPKWGSHSDVVIGAVD